MTIKDVERQLERIADFAARREGPSAHAIQDELFHDVLKAIAAGHPQSQALAKAALKSADMEFDRWCE